MKDLLVGFTTMEGGFYAMGHELGEDGGTTFRRHGEWTSAYFDEVGGRVVATRSE